jgi:hypothetical protein
MSAIWGHLSNQYSESVFPGYVEHGVTNESLPSTYPTFFAVIGTQPDFAVHGNQPGYVPLPTPAKPELICLVGCTGPHAQPPVWTNTPEPGTMNGFVIAIAAYAVFRFLGRKVA